MVHSISVRTVLVHQSQLLLFVAEVTKEFSTFLSTVMPFEVKFMKTKKVSKNIVNSGVLRWSLKHEISSNSVIQSVV